MFVDKMQARPPFMGGCCVPLVRCARRAPPNSDLMLHFRRFLAAICGADLSFQDLQLQMCLGPRIQMERGTKKWK